MNKLQVIEHQNQRILTTQQLAENYETDNRRISENFNANKVRYTLGKHYFLLEGADLKAFGDQYGNSVSVTRVNKLYLWTEKGAWLHAKSLNTDKAWEAYEALVDDYFKKTEAVKSLSELSPQLQVMINLELKHQVLEQRLCQTNAELKDLKRGLVDLDKPLRSQFVAAVMEHKNNEKLGSFKNAYDDVYKLVNAQHRVDIRKRAKNRNARPIDILEELNLLVPAIRIAKALCEKKGD